jgi:hypothetical protein
MDKLDAFTTTYLAMVQRFRDIDALAMASGNDALVHHWKWFFSNCQVRVFPSTLPCSIHRSPCLPFIISLLQHLSPRLLPILTLSLCFSIKPRTQLRGTNSRHGSITSTTCSLLRWHLPSTPHGLKPSTNHQLRLLQTASM